MSEPAMRPKTTKPPSRPSNLTRAELEAMVEDALVDAYTGEEQRVAFYTSHWVEGG